MHIINHNNIKGLPIQNGLTINNWLGWF